MVWMGELGTWDWGGEGGKELGLTILTGPDCSKPVTDQQ